MRIRSKMKRSLGGFLLGVRRQGVGPRSEGLMRENGCGIFSTVDYSNIAATGDAGSAHSILLEARIHDKEQCFYIRSFVHQTPIPNS